MIALFALIGAIPGVLVLRQAYALYKNYQRAKQSHLPIILSPLHPFDTFFIVFQPWLMPLLRLLPGTFKIVLPLDWQFADRGRLHQKLGPAFVLCAPSGNTLHLADNTAIEEVLAKYRRFPKPDVIYCRSSSPQECSPWSHR